MATKFIHSNVNSTLSCTEIQKTWNKTAFEYLLEKCNEHARQGKTTMTLDALSGESFDYAQYDPFTKNTASAFYKKGLRKGDIVVHMCYDMAKLHLFTNGVWRANGVVQSIYPEELEDSIYDTVVGSKAKWILCDSTEASRCLAVAKRLNFPLEVIVTSQDCIEGCSSIFDYFYDDGLECPILEIDENDPAAILCTSGTTGASKGAVHSHKNIVYLWTAFSHVFKLQEISLFVSKSSHMSGAILTQQVFLEGHTLITMSRNTTDNVINAFEKYKPGFLFAFPSFLTTIAYDPRTKNTDKTSVKCIATGGTPVKSNFESQLKEQFVNLTYMTQAYGLTESLPLTSSIYLPDSESTITSHKDLPSGSIGKVCAGVSLQIRNEDGVEVLGPNEHGELCVKSPMMFLHYLGKEKETRDTFTSDGYFRTGDVGYYDENGFVFTIGRKKEMFKSFTNHVYPHTIDQVIIKHPSVAEVCTIGVDDPIGDEKMPRAFVVLKPGATTTTADEIKEFANKNLPTYKHLRGGLYCVPNLPKGSTGKVTSLLVAQLQVPEL